MAIQLISGIPVGTQIIELRITIQPRGSSVIHGTLLSNGIVSSVEHTIQDPNFLLDLVMEEYLDRAPIA